MTNIHPLPRTPEASIDDRLAAFQPRPVRRSSPVATALLLGATAAALGGGVALAAVLLATPAQGADRMTVAVTSGAPSEISIGDPDPTICPGAVGMVTFANRQSNGPANTGAERVIARDLIAARIVFAWNVAGDHDAVTIYPDAGLVAEPERLVVPENGTDFSCLFAYRMEGM